MNTHANASQYMPNSNVFMYSWYNMVHQRMLESVYSKIEFLNIWEVPLHIFISGQSTVTSLSFWCVWLPNWCVRKHGCHKRLYLIETQVRFHSYGHSGIPVANSGLYEPWGSGIYQHGSDISGYLSSCER